MKPLFVTDEDAKVSFNVFPGKHLQPSLIFLRKAGAYQRGASYRHLNHKFWKGLPETNDLSFSTALVIKEKNYSVEIRLQFYKRAQNLDHLSLPSNFSQA